MKKLWKYQSVDSAVFRVVFVNVFFLLFFVLLFFVPLYATIPFILTLIVEYTTFYHLCQAVKTQKEVNGALNFLWLKKADDQDIYLVINYNGYPSSIFYQDHNYASEGKKAAHQITKVEYAESVTLYLIIFGNDDPRNIYVVNEVVNSINHPTVYLRRE